mgnify:CR=1 FL=1
MPPRVKRLSTASETSSASSGVRRRRREGLGGAGWGGRKRARWRRVNPEAVRSCKELVSGRQLREECTYGWYRLVVATPRLGDLVVEQGDAEDEVGDAEQRQHQAEEESKEW